jgi:hypothetical protein
MRRMPRRKALLPCVLLACGCGGAENERPQRDGVEACGAGDLSLAPPAVDVDGLHAVPVDISSLEATMVLDGATKITSVEAHLRFRTGPSDGAPVFDLRQTLERATLNGAELELGRLRHHALGGGDGADLRVIEATVPACSENQLDLDYRLEQPDVFIAPPVIWDAAAPGASWESYFSDLNPARYLEQWFPANLVYDRFAFALEIEIRNSGVPHTLVTTGDFEALAENHWRVRYPPTSTALSPLLVLVPSERVETRVVELSEGSTGPVRLELHRDLGAVADLAALAETVRESFAEFTASTGPYPFGERLTLYVGDDSLRHAMEYDGGATTTVATVRHELFHAWYGRGVKPVNQDAGWIDEAWNDYSTLPDGAFASVPLDFGAPPATLDSSNPWNRVTSSEAYGAGVTLFAGLADIMGLELLRASMRSFYERHVGGLVTTRNLEHHLVCASRDPRVAAAFERFVHGRDGTSATSLGGECD